MSALVTAETQRSTEQEEPEKVRLWRMLKLLEAGYDKEDAEAIAHRQEVDLHDAVELVKNKRCPVAKAVEILL